MQAFATASKRLLQPACSLGASQSKREFIQKHWTCHSVQPRCRGRGVRAVCAVSDPQFGASSSRGQEQATSTTQSAQPPASAAARWAPDFNFFSFISHNFLLFYSILITLKRKSLQSFSFVYVYCFRYLYFVHI